MGRRNRKRRRHSKAMFNGLNPAVKCGGVDPHDAEPPQNRPGFMNGYPTTSCNSIPPSSFTKPDNGEAKTGFLDDEPAKSDSSRSGPGHFKEEDGWVKQANGCWVHDPSKAKTQTGSANSSSSSSGYYSTTRRPSAPTLKFSAYAMAKLTYLRDKGSTEIGGLLVMDAPFSFRVVDFIMPKQRCTSVTVKFDDYGLLQLYEDLHDQKIDNGQFVPWWAHTHPGNSASPSGVDEETFQRVYGDMNVAMMFILARGGETYCRLRCNMAGGIGFDVDCPVTTDFSIDSLGWGDKEKAEWDKEYDNYVIKEPYSGGYSGSSTNYYGYGSPSSYQGPGHGGYYGGKSSQGDNSNVSHGCYPTTVPGTGGGVLLGTPPTASNNAVTGFIDDEPKQDRGRNRGRGTSKSNADERNFHNLLSCAEYDRLLYAGAVGVGN